MRPHDASIQIIEFTPAMRTLIKDAIEAPVLLLDEIDGDAGLEDGWNLEEEPDREDVLDKEGESGIDDADGFEEKTGLVNDAGCSYIE